MKIKLSMDAIHAYIKQTGKSLNQIAQEADLSYSTLNRYARGERMPDIKTLVHLCNTLHIRIDNFFIHPDIEPTHVSIIYPEEWSDIVFRYDRIEAIRLNKSLSKTAMVQEINLAGGCNISRLTYDHLITGNHFGTATIVGLIVSQDVDLDYLFEQPQMGENEDSMIVSRKKFVEMKDYIKKLENDYRELLLKNKRLEKMTLSRYSERMENKDADKVIREFMRKMERAYADLRSWTDEDHEPVTFSPSVPYPEQEERVFVVAEE